VDAVADDQSCAPLPSSLPQQRPGSLARLVAAVAIVLGLEADSVRKPSKSRLPTLARGIICHLAIFEFGYLGSEVGKYLYLGSSGVSLAAKRGEKYLKAEKMVRAQIMDAIAK
jgi:hypothetical protein